MAINNILVTETTPKHTRQFSIQRSGRSSLKVTSNNAGNIEIENGHMGLMISPDEAKALIEVLQELTK